ncbi:MAG: cupin domain-containing protein [Planctomycetota bacterium]
MEPGLGYPAHRHLEGEQVLVLQGGYRDGLGEYRTGDFVAYGPGSEHDPCALGRADLPEGPGNPACVLLAFAPGGIELV